MQRYTKQALQACLRGPVFIRLYGEKPFMSKKKASKRRFCEWGSESLIIYLKIGGYYE
jgi:hypothetical protein